MKFVLIFVISVFQCESFVLSPARLRPQTWQRFDADPSIEPSAIAALIYSRLMFALDLFDEEDDQEMLLTNVDELGLQLYLDEGGAVIAIAPNS